MTPQSDDHTLRTPEMEHAPPRHHPLDSVLRSEVLPHIWCPGCGIGVALGAFLQGLDRAGIPLEKRVLVGGIGCSSRVVYYARADAYHTTHGRAIPFATGIKLANPSLHVTVFAGDGDLFAIGGNHFIHAARRNMDLLVVCINNFNYGMTGGQSGPTTPHDAKTTTTPSGNFEFPFNLPQLAAAVGAVYVARWTTLDVRRLRDCFTEAASKQGFRFVEVLAPCPVSFGKSNDIGSGLDEMDYYRGLERIWGSPGGLPSRVEVRETGDLTGTDISLHRPIIVGKFVDRARPTFLDNYKAVATAAAKGKAP
jgi:2-oxoglutarate ferredoxin oxidoreductase subunit beta